ncbi:carbohydrate ABC transporter permease [Haloferax sp. YSMS24]|uniref:carbohydrate ABC transporter permease n=1 Tax=Haloferax sp. YSMS24 TaxID=3388425 RepID=UPI00398CC0A8
MSEINGLFLKGDVESIKKKVNGYVTPSGGLLSYVYLLIGILLSAVWLFPLYWLVRLTLEWPATGLLGRTPSLQIDSVTVYNFIRIIYEVEFLTFLTNSVIITLLAVVGTVIFNSLAAYALTFDFPGRKLFMGIFVSSMFIPIYITIVPGFIITRELGLLNTHLGVALPLAGSVIGTLILYASFQSIPSSVIESARLDGASELYILFGILWPMSSAALATNVILAFIRSWNAFLWPLMIVTERDVYTLPLGLANYNANYGGSPALQYAFAVLVLLPVVITFLFLQKYFIRGVVQSAIKE